MEDQQTSQKKTPISPVLDSPCETPRVELSTALASEVETEFNRFFEMRDAVRKALGQRRGRAAAEPQKSSSYR